MHDDAQISEIVYKHRKFRVDNHRQARSETTGRMALTLNTYDQFESQVADQTEYTSPKELNFGDLPPIDLEEHEKEFVMVADAQLDPYLIKVDFDDETNSLHVFGEHADNGKTERFERTIRFGEGVVDSKKLESCFSGGVLRITVPKLQK